LALDARGVALLGSRAADAGLTDAREALALVAALPARQRAVLTLQVSGRGYREIAARLRMTERTVERHVLRARAAVRCADGAPPDAARRVAA
jgi:DNA-directed RNA polymerase specialized sigma24 family protein